MTARHRRQVCSRPGRLSQDRELLLDTEPAPPFHAPEQLSSRVGHRSCAIPSSSSKPASTSLPRRPQDGPHRRDTPLPAGSPLQSEPQNELERKAPRPSSPGPCRFPTKAICCRIFIPALPDCPVASVVRDFCSGDLKGGLEDKKWLEYAAVPSRLTGLGGLVPQLEAAMPTETIERGSRSSRRTRVRQLSTAIRQVS